MQRIFTRRKGFASIFLLLSVLQIIKCDLTLSTNDISVLLDEKSDIELIVSNIKYDNVILNFYVQHDDIIKISPKNVTLKRTSTSYKVKATLEGVGAGHSEITSNTTNPDVDADSVFLRVLVLKNQGLETFSLAIGWIYFVAWSISFYPQIYINWKRKSVVGLNFDFLVLNIIGFTLYSIFNLGLYFISEIKVEYSLRFPRGVNPVQVNDIVFAVHATVACVITIVQCFIYERGDQRVSLTARIIIGAFGLFLFISVILAGVDTIHWLDYLYYCSYVKLTITLIKYVPQAYMNYKRKSTVGWSIGNIFLDFTGGILSMLQMILNAYNYDDWVSIFGDPTKFGLGLFSVVFDIFFILQHYVFYRHTNYEDSP